MKRKCDHCKRRKASFAFKHVERIGKNGMLILSADIKERLCAECWNKRVIIA